MGEIRQLYKTVAIKCDYCGGQAVEAPSTYTKNEYIGLLLDTKNSFLPNKYRREVCIDCWTEVFNRTLGKPKSFKNRWYRFWLGIKNWMRSKINQLPPDADA